MEFSSYHIADFVLDEATQQFAPMFRLSQERLDIFKQYCSVLDRMVEEFNGSTLQVEVDDEDMSVHMTLELDEFTVDSSDRAVFTQLIEHAISVRFEHGDEDTLRMTLVFPSLWEKAV